MQLRPGPGGAAAVLAPFDRQDSSIVSSLPWADGLARIPADTPVHDGEWVDYYDLAHWLA